MYEKFFGLLERPFSLLPDPSYLYMSPGHTRALTLLRYSILGRQGFTVVTGEIGSGKTTLVNQLVGETSDDISIGLLNFTDPEASDLNEWVAMAFGLDHAGKSRAELYEDFISYLISQYAQGKHTVLIVDEAQNLILKGLEKIRMLSNVNAKKEHLLHLILVGQPQLRTLLNSPELEQLVQRISVSYHLDRLSTTESETYIKHRLSVAGAGHQIFSTDALRDIAKAGGGVPRIINNICDLALVYGFSAGQNTINTDLVSEVLHDRQEMGLLQASTEAAGHTDTETRSSDIQRHKQ